MGHVGALRRLPQRTLTRVFGILFLQQNMGAVVRSAAFLGCAGVLSCARNSAPLSPVVSKASAGAVEWLVMHSARNLPRTLSAAAASGWEVLGEAPSPFKPYVKPYLSWLGGPG